MTKKRIIQEQLPEIEENEIIDGKTVKNRGIFLLPNLITTTALFAGFYSIIASINGNFKLAGVALICAMIFDGLDGRVARMTNSQSAFGAEFDSLSDMIAFGVAPAILAFNWVLIDLGKIGWIAAFIYILSTAFRLARFNVNQEVTDKNYFVGLPSPTAAALIVALALNFHSFDKTSVLLQISVTFMTILAGVLMVSNINYNSFKSLSNEKRMPFFKLILGAGYLILLIVFFKEVFFATAYIYTFLGIVLTIKNFLIRKPQESTQTARRVEPAEADSQLGSSKEE